MFVIWGIPYRLGGIYDFLQGQEVCFTQYPTIGSLLPSWLPNGWLIVGIVLFLIVTFEGAYQRFKKLTTTKLEVEVEPSDYIDKGTGWRHLRVRNPTSRVIKGCYGMLKDFRAVTPVPKDTELPRIGIRYPWSTRHGEIGILADIGSRSFKILDIAACSGGETQEFRTPLLASDGWTRWQGFGLPEGTYEVEIEVGSEGEDLPPMCKKFRIVFSGGTDLEIEESKEGNSGIVQ